MPWHYQVSLLLTSDLKLFSLITHLWNLQAWRFEASVKAFPGYTDYQSHTSQKQNNPSLTFAWITRGNSYKKGEKSSLFSSNYLYSMLHSWQLNDVTNINNYSRSKCFWKNTKILENKAFEKRLKKGTLVKWLAFTEITKIILAVMDNSNICSPKNPNCPVTDDAHPTDMTNKRHLIFNGFCNFFLYFLREQHTV